jgi:uncharacterized OB-fold protein
MMDKYDLFMKEYHERKKLCPKCGSLSHSTTLAAYIFNESKPEEYKDMNRCTCQNCGDKHVTHDRISVEEFRDGKISQIINN